MMSSVVNDIAPFCTLAASETGGTEAWSGAFMAFRGEYRPRNRLTQSPGCAEALEQIDARTRMLKIALDLATRILKSSCSAQGAEIRTNAYFSTDSYRRLPGFGLKLTVLGRRCLPLGVPG
jgi:hypothetical protein